ncbi:MAG: TolC family protein [Verrucomicrobia bacterium]|nr:TolC family protein [Verrucomicrobiota bacterium]
MKLRLLFLALGVAWCANLPLAAAEPWTLERAISVALTNNPDARIAQHRIAAARAGLDATRAAYWPQAQFQSSYTRTDNPIGVFGAALNQRSYTSSLNFNDVPDADNLNVKGLLTVPLYNGGRTKAGRDAARANTEAARQNAQAVRNTLEFEVARAFHTVLKTREFVRATKSSVHSFEGNLNIASNRFNASTILKIELLDMEVRLAQAREDLVRARNASNLATRSLGNLLGVEDADFTVATTAPESVVPDGKDFSQRSELAASREQRRAAEAEVRRAHGGYFPRLNAFGSLDYDRGWKFNGDGHSYTAGVLVQWNLWDGQLTRAKVSGARADLDTAREDERKLRLALDLEVEQARLSLQEASERLAVTGKSVAQATESAELTRARFEQGLAIATQLIDSETALAVARVRRAEAEAYRSIAIAALRKAVGLSLLSPTQISR